MIINDEAEWLSMYFDDKWFLKNLVRNKSKIASIAVVFLGE